MQNKNGESCISILENIAARYGAFLKTEHSDGSKSVVYGYDASGNRIEMDDESGKSHTTYDELGRVKSYTDGDGRSAAYYVSHSLNQYEITRRSIQTAGDRLQADLSACSQNSGCPMNSHLRWSNSIGHHLILWLASPESALLRSRRSVLPCE